MQRTLGVDGSPQEAAILNASVLKLDYLVLTFAVAHVKFNHTIAVGYVFLMINQMHVLTMTHTCTVIDTEGGGGGEGGKSPPPLADIPPPPADTPPFCGHNIVLILLCNV